MRAMTNWAKVEREALCDLFVEVGPDVPTLCGDWTTRDLAAHLIVRERRPDAAAGILFKPLAGRTEKVQREIASKPWAELVASVRKGPPIFSPTAFAPVDRLVNTVEFFVHHEDVRRAQDGWEPRALEPGLEGELWTALSRMGRMLARQVDVGVTLARPDGRSATLRKGTPTVMVIGPPSELLLFCYGRQAHSRVELAGPTLAIESLRTARLGI